MTESFTEAPRQQARLRGERTYSTGQPCKHGHICPRYVADTKCVECTRVKSKKDWKKRRITHSEIDQDRWRDYREQNREKLSTYNRSVQSLPRRLASQKKWRDANKEYNRARKLDYRAANLNVIRSRENTRNAENRELRRLQDQANRDRRRDQYKATKREWSRNNRDKVALKARRRRARHAGAEGSHTLLDLARIRRLQNDRCAYCSTDLAGAGYVDHIVALANGGSNWPRNLQLVCLRCNSSKRVRDPIEFARATGRLL